MRDIKKRVLTDEEVEWLAEAYLRLKNSKTYQSFSQAFWQFANDYLEEQLLEIKRMKGEQYARA